MNISTIQVGILISYLLPQDGTTPLYIASEKGHSDVVNILIRSGAGVDKPANVSDSNIKAHKAPNGDKDGSNSLEEARMRSEGYGTCLSVCVFVCYRSSSYSVCFSLQPTALF